jgi:myo-inositol-1(or 4)-monophosphatase
MSDKQLLAVAREAANAGAAVLASHWGGLLNIRSKGRPGDLLTVADLAAEAAVLEVLAERTPEISVLAEESGLSGEPGEWQWCVDPLDGTTNYAHGYPLFSCSVGLLHNGMPLLGAVVAPAMQLNFSGGLGIGASCNGEALEVSSCASLAEALLVTGFAYDRCETINNNYTEFCHFTHHSHGVRRCGSAALDLAFVAAGRLDGYWERGLQPWDLAAGVALVQAAGGSVCDYDGTPLQLNSGRVLACSPAILQSMINGIAQCRPMPVQIYS